MPSELNREILPHLEQIEKVRNSRVLVLAASQLDMELLPELLNKLQSIGHVKRLDVVLHCKGGVVNAARRIALLLRRYTEHLAFVVPYCCESAATLLTFAADEVLAGELAIFTPIDPHLHGGSEPDGIDATAMSCLDIMAFGKMCEDWFGVSSQQAQNEALQLLCASIFPPTLTAFYRSTEEMRTIGVELLKHQLPELSLQNRSQVVECLMFNYHSHNYALTAEEMSSLGLNFHSSSDIEKSAWAISSELQRTIGGAVRASEQAPWFDALLATKEGAKLRQKSTDGLAGTWITKDW